MAEKLGRDDFRQKCFENRQPKNLGREIKKMDKASGFLVDFEEFKIDPVLSHNPHWTLGFWGVESGSPKRSCGGLKMTPQNRRFQWGFVSKNSGGGTKIILDELGWYENNTAGTDPPKIADFNGDLAQKLGGCYENNTGWYENNTAVLFSYHPVLQVRKQ